MPKREPHHGQARRSPRKRVLQHLKRLDLAEQAALLGITEGELENRRFQEVKRIAAQAPSVRAYVSGPPLAQDSSRESGIRVAERRSSSIFY